MNDENCEKKLGRSELQGWLRTLLTIFAFVGGMYYSKGQILSLIHI